ncbi:hypothetical protein V8E54_003103 [Elaphomyces granulatus]
MHNLKAVLDVSIVCRIMLVENLWTERGLVNGAFGTMEDRYPWSSDVTNPSKEPPYALLVHFDRYDDRDTIQFDSILYHDRLCHTVHKAQDITFLCGVLKIGDDDFAPGLTYMAISRVKSLLFEESCILRERGGDIERRRAEQHVSDKYSPCSWQIDSLQLLPHPIPAVPLLFMLQHASSEIPEE